MDETKEISKLREDLSRMKEEYQLRSRKMYLYQLELEKKLHYLHKEKCALSEHIEKLEYLNSQLPSNIFLQPPSRDFSFSNYGTEETSFSFGEVEENAEINRVPYIPMDYHTQKIIEIPYIYLPSRTGYEVTRDFPIILGETIAEKYRIDRIIANTQTSCVLACLDLSKKTKVCVKVVQNDKRSFERGLTELRVLINLKSSCKDISQHHIVKLLDHFYFKEHLFIVQELLYESLSLSNLNLNMNLTDLKQFATEILKSLSLLSSNHIIHCDINPENILQVKKSGESEIHYKLIDFNSAITPNDSELHSYPTLAYTAPEIIESQFTPALDMWSFGCILTEVYIGSRLFSPMSEQELLYSIQETIGLIPGKRLEHSLGWDKPKSIESRLPPEDELFKDLITKILSTDHKTRITAKEALNHPWLN